MKTFFLSLFLTLSSFAFSQEKLNPNLIIDLTEQQAFQRYKSSNVRKALKLKIKDFNYKELIQYAQTDKLSEIVILNNLPANNLESVKDLYDLGQTSLESLKETGIGYPCEDCGMIIYYNLKELKQHPFYFPKE